MTWCCFFERVRTVWMNALVMMVKGNWEPQWARVRWIGSALRHFSGPWHLSMTHTGVLYAGHARRRYWLTVNTIESSTSTCTRCSASDRQLNILNSQLTIVLCCTGMLYKIILESLSTVVKHWNRFSRLFLIGLRSGNLFPYVFVLFSDNSISFIHF